MRNHSLEATIVSKVCANIKDLGYAPFSRVRLYGEEFEILSDPFPKAGGIVVRARSKKDPKICILHLPAMILQSARGSMEHAAEEREVDS